MRKPFHICAMATAALALAALPYPIDDNADDPAVWGKAFPLQYELYLKTVDMSRTKYGGSEALPHAPTQGDPRSIVSQSKVEEDPGLKAKLAELGAEPVPVEKANPQALQSHLKAEIAKWDPIIKKAGVYAD